MKQRALKEISIGFALIALALLLYRVGVIREVCYSFGAVGVVSVGWGVVIVLRK